MKFVKAGEIGGADMGTILNQQAARTELAANLRQAFLRELALDGTPDQQRYVERLAEIALSVFESS